MNVLLYVLLLGKTDCFLICDFSVFLHAFCGASPIAGMCQQLKMNILSPYHDKNIINR